MVLPSSYAGHFSQQTDYKDAGRGLNDAVFSMDHNRRVSVAEKTVLVSEKEKRIGEKVGTATCSQVKDQVGTESSFCHGVILNSGGKGSGQRVTHKEITTML